MFTKPINFSEYVQKAICRPYLWFLIALLLCGWSSALAQESQGAVQKVRSLYPSEWEVPRPAGVAYSTAFTELFLLEKNKPALPGAEGTQVVVITPYEHFVGAVPLDFTVDNAINIAFADQSASLFLLNQAQAQLAQIKLGADGLPDPATLQRFAIGRLGLGNPQGLASDATSQSLFILDSATSRVISMTLKIDTDIAEAPFSIIDLSALGVSDLRGIAVHPLNHNLYVASPTAQKLYEVTIAGQLVTSYDLSSLALTDQRGFVFAPSADLTDPPTTIQLFLADSKLADNQSEESAQRLGEILELELKAEGDANPVQSFSTRVANSVDDAEEYTAHEPVRLESTDLELIQDGRSHQIVGVRFANVTIPAGAIILTATITFETDEVYTVATALVFAGEAIDNATPFTATVNNISMRSLTTARVDWQNVPVWVVVGDEQQTPNLAPIVQEVINRPGWTSGNALAFIITGEGKRVAKAFDGNPAAAPRLGITYVLPQ